MTYTKAQQIIFHQQAIEERQRQRAKLQEQIDRLNDEIAVSTREILYLRESVT